MSLRTRLILTSIPKFLDDLFPEVAKDFRRALEHADELLLGCDSDTKKSETNSGETEFFVRVEER